MYILDTKYIFIDQQDLMFKPTLERRGQILTPAHQILALEENCFKLCESESPRNGKATHMILIA